MLERDIEAALVKRIKKLGGLCEKFTSPGRRSVPDRLVTLPGGTIIFVELKAPGKKATEKQERDHAIRRKLGCIVYVVSSLEGIDLVFPLDQSKTAYEWCILDGPDDSEDSDSQEDDFYMTTMRRKATPFLPITTGRKKKGGKTDECKL